MKRIFIIVIILNMGLVFTGPTYAELYNRGTDILGNSLIYDSDLNITWYDYSNSQGSWTTQHNWAANLSVNFGGSIYDDWRLPISINWDAPAYYSTESEMGHLYYTEFGNTPETGLLNKGPFQNILPADYWTNTVDADAANHVLFRFSDGYETQHDSRVMHYALAVRSGDVSVVPEPISSILFITGGSLLAGRRYIKRNNRA